MIAAIKKDDAVCSYPKLREKLNLLEETVLDDMEHLETSKDEDARTKHKIADTSFFGYKTHIAMSEERIITAAIVTSGEKPDGKELPELVAGIEELSAALLNTLVEKITVGESQCGERIQKVKIYYKFIGCISQ